MTDQTTLTDEILAEADAVAKKAEADIAAEQAEAKIDVTDLARKMAEDYDIPLSEVKGTGKNGRITVPDVDKHKKALDKMVEQSLSDVDAQIVEPEVKDEPEKPKPRPITKSFVAAGKLPNVIVGLTEVYHIVRTLSEVGMGWMSSQVSVLEADDELSKMISDGWELLYSQTLGYSEFGLDVIWVLGRFAEGKIERFPYHEIHHITRRVGGGGARAISGTDANSYISGYLQSGWDLALVEAIDKAADGVVNILWILVR